MELVSNMDELRTIRVSLQIQDSEWKELNNLMRSRGHDITNFFTSLTLFGISYLKSESPLTEKIIEFAENKEL